MMKREVRVKSRTSNVIGSLVFLVAVPGTVAGLVPYWITRWRVQPPLLGQAWLRAAGALLATAGAAVLLDSFARFALEGRGTPAPVAPPERLVVRGLFRHVRNPMYVAVTSAVLGQALLLGSVPLLGYALLLVAAFHAFVVGYEEPALRRSFGDQYAAYCAGVPRWLPRLAPWKGAA
jgi:protein-S-isoprenylcysteine O-methyltransferase Ste14